MELSATQQGVLKGMGLGALVTIILAALCLWQSGVLITSVSSYSISDIGMMTVLERLQFAIRWMLLPLSLLMIAIGRMARHRFTSPADIDGGVASNGSVKTRVLQSLLQNTLEQAVLACFVYLIWAAVMPAHYMSAIPLAATAFVLGRILFFSGYQSGASHRAFGFALTFYPSVLMLLVLLVFVA